MAAGSCRHGGRVAREHAAGWHGPGTRGGARIPFDGRRASLPGAAFAAAGSTDALDAHDGHATAKGHVGLTAAAAALGFADECAPSTLKELLTRVLVGYEVGTRAGIACHRIQTQYHTSGAWNALAAAAIGARALRLSSEPTLAALGGAAFQAPRGDMMTVIDEPSMLKDGSATGAFAGTTAALLAEEGFTASSADVLTDARVTDLWADLGVRWRVLEQYMKPYPVCRWAQPALEAAAQIYPQLRPDAIERVTVATFREAVRLAGAAPATSDAAQYAIAFPLAVMLRHGRLDPGDIDGDALEDPTTLALAARIALIPDRGFDARFPEERLATVEVEEHDGTRHQAGPVAARGDPDAAFSDAALAAKARALLVAGMSGEAGETLITALLTQPRVNRPATRALEPVLRGERCTPFP